VTAAAESGLDIDFEVNSLYSLPFPAESFDAIFCHGVLEHLTRPTQALGEIHRLLRRGGVLGVVEADCDSLILWPPDPWLDRAQQFVEALWETCGGWGYPEGEASNLHVGKQLRALLKETGFEPVVGSGSLVCDGTDEDTARAGEHEARLLEAPPLVAHAAAAGLATPAELSAMANAWRSWGMSSGAFRSKCVCQALGWK
jgi:SAM-dependent methyltransferase